MKTITTTEPEKIGESIRYVQTTTTTEEKEITYNIAELNKKKSCIEKAISDTEKGKTDVVARHDATVAMLNDQIAVIDEKIAQANVLLTAEPIE